MSYVSARRAQTPILNQTLHMTQEMHKTKHSLFWGVVNGFLMALLLYDVINTCEAYTSTMIFCEWLIIVVLFLNSLYHFGQYLRVSFYLDPVVLTPRQKKLMGISDTGQSVEQPTNLLSSFWNHPATRSTSEVPVTLRRCTYQLAPPTTLPTPGSPGVPADETGSLSSSLLQSQDVWRRVKVNPNVLTQWNANLRMWISQTILDRLVKEIDAVDEALQRHGLADVKVGLVGLERLKKTAQILQVAQNIPTLVSLVPFLELSPNQEYLVTRIREHLPTDSAIIMHLFATYLDSQLPPLPQNPDGRPFTTQHFAKTPDKPPQGKNTLAIYQVQINPPHYVLIDGEDTLEVLKGRNNLFHTLLLFLRQVNTKEHGMLGRVNLGPSGINLLWVIQT
ncbi:hypothetical protein C0J52_14608 [Blattella germanica]|nr:hypothetical protein C0J52_14608 [Blattella germanica]